MCQKLGTMHCCQVFKYFLMLCYTYHTEYLNPLQRIELFVQGFWQALPIKTLKYGADFEKKQLNGVKEIMATDKYLQPMTERQSLTVWRSLASRFPT